MALRSARQPSSIQANLTPMIDVIFLLIVFFVLVSQIVDIETVDLTLPRPADPASITPGDERRIVVNVLPDASGATRGYGLEGDTLPATERGLDELRRRLAARFAETPSLQVNLRADESTHYDHVQPVLDAVRRAAGTTPGRTQPPRVNLVVVRETRP